MSGCDDERTVYEQRIVRQISAFPQALRAVDLASLDRTDCSDAIDAATAWATSGGGLLLTGPVGAGKTTIAAGGLRLWALTHPPHPLQQWIGNWISGSELVADLAAGFGTPRYVQADEAISASTPVVVDDLDKIRSSEHGAEHVFRLVNGAIVNERPLIVTTNLTLDELADRWPEPHGDAIASRLAGYCDSLEVKGADRRLRGAT